MVEADERSLKTGGSIKAKNLSMTFGSGESAVRAMGPVDLDIKPGEFVSILGPSGCGKSTTMLMLAGLLKPTRGEIFINEKPLTKPLTDVGIVFQDHLLLEFKTAMANVMLQQKIRKLDQKTLSAVAESLFKQLGLEGAEKKYPSQLSGGMCQRVSIARALVHDPSLLFMDEPFGALDAISRTQIRHDLELLWLETKKTVLFITHSVEEAVGLSDRVLVMTQSPGVIAEEIIIDLPRPRPAHLGRNPKFSKFADRIFETFEKLGIHNFQEKSRN